MNILEKDKNNYESNIKLKLEFVFLTLLSFFYTLPIVNSFLPFYVFLFFECAYIIYVFILSDKITRFNIFLWVSLAIVITFCYFYLTETKTVSEDDPFYDFKRFISKFNQLITFFTPIVLLLRVKLFPKKYVRRLITISVLCILLTVFRSLMFYISNFSSSFARDWPSFDVLERKNIATYSYVYSISIFLPALFNFSEAQIKRTYKIFGFALCLFLFIFLCFAQYTIALVLPIVCIFISSLTKKRKEIAVFIVLIPIVLFFLPQILYNFCMILPYGTIRNRLLASSSFMFGNTSGNSELLDRLDLYKRSIFAFFDSPLIGNKQLSFDGHATFLTILSDVGLVGFVPAFFLYFWSKEKIKYLLENSFLYKKWFPSFLAMIALGFLNPIHASFNIGFVVWFLGPSLLKFYNFDILGEKDNEYNALYCMWI